jgi:hypothetical protein
MNLAELFKFGSDWMDDLVTRDELAWAFHIVNAIKATSDEMTGELNFAEFLQTLVYIGMIAFWDSLEVRPAALDSVCVMRVAHVAAPLQEEFSAYQWACMKGTISGKAKVRSERCLRCMDCLFEHLHLGQYTYMKNRLSVLGRTTSGFGAWKPSPHMLHANGISTAPVYRAKKFARSIPHEKHLLPLEVLNASAQYLQKLPPPAKTTMWKNFGGPYIAMQLPAVHPPGCPHRFKVDIEVMNEALEVTAELDELPFACVKYLPKVLKPGFPNRCVACIALASIALA